MIPEGYEKKDRMSGLRRGTFSGRSFALLAEPLPSTQRFPGTKFYSLKRIPFMSGSLRYTRAVSAEVGEIERRLRSIEKSLEKIGARASTHAKDTAQGLGDAVASGLLGWADRFRQATGSLGDQAEAIRRDAADFGAKFGTQVGGSALTKVSDETERHPLFALAVAIGVGVLIGMVSKSRD
jgi:ElaB/YqjD/DUF883 family membrane-anchored ribosome-binding protein